MHQKLLKMPVIKTIKLYILSFFVQWFLFFIFRTNKWIVIDEEKFLKAINDPRPILISTWHSRLLYGIYYLKLSKKKNLWAISSTHEDSQIMAYFLKRSNFNLIKGSSTRGWNNVIKKMIKLFKSKKTIIAITNDGPKGPPKIAKYGSYKIAKKCNAQIVTISCNSTSFWKINSWDTLQIPKPFGTIYIKFSDPLDYSKDSSNNADLLTNFLNKNLYELDSLIDKK